jgi:hypothetical protein
MFSTEIYFKMKLIKFSSCLILFFIFYSCNPAGPIPGKLTVTIVGKENNPSGFLCNSVNSRQTQVIDYQITVFSYDASRRPVKWGAINRVSSKFGLNGNQFEIDVPKTGEFTIEIRGTSRDCIKTALCIERCGKETYHFISPMITSSTHSSIHCGMEYDGIDCSC